MRERQHWIWLSALIIAGAWYIAPPTNQQVAAEQAPIGIADLLE